MNKLSGYGAFTLNDGNVLEMKFGNATYEIFGRLLGLTNLQEIDAALRPEMRVDLDGQSVPVVTFEFMRNSRLFVQAAIEYAAKVQGYTEVAGVQLASLNEWIVGEWIEEIGETAIMDLVPKAETEPAKKKPMSSRVKAIQ